MWDKAKNYATGIWSSSIARGSAEWKLNKEEILHGVMRNTKIGSTNHSLNAYDSIINIGNTMIKNGGLSSDDALNMKKSLPTYGNAFMNSFTSKGSMKAAGIGAGAGGIYGSISDDTSILKGASIGAGLGYVGKGLLGMAGERRTLSDKALSNITRHETNSKSQSIADRFVSDIDDLGGWDDGLDFGGMP